MWFVIYLLILREDMPVLPLVKGTQLCEYIDDGVRKLRFEIIENVGAGTFGITYTAKDASFNNTLCVIKEFALAQLCNRDTRSGSIVPFKSDDPRKDKHRKRLLKTWQDRFILEANNLNKIHHSNVVSVRLAWRERGTVFYAMNYVEGKELSSPDKKDWEPQSWSEIEPLAFKLLDALEAVHEVDLIHGDVKPSNVLLTKKNEPMLIDFGTARNLADFQNTLQQGTHAYTPGYAPPELHGVNNTKSVSPSSDLYSWGMIIIGLLKRHPKTHDGSPMDAMFRYQNFDRDPYSNLSSWLTNVPLNVLEVLQKCVQLDYEKRPKTVAETRDLFASETIDSDKAAKQIEELQKALREEKELAQRKLQEEEEQKRVIQAQRKLAQRTLQEEKQKVIQAELAQRKLQEEKQKELAKRKKQKTIQAQKTFQEKKRIIQEQVFEKPADVLVAKPKGFLIVGGINGYLTIREALRVASSETTIRILPGTYRESLIIDKNITIIGVGNREQIIIIGSEKSTILSTAKQARIQNVTLQQEDGDNPCVDISSGEIQIEGCDISGGNNCIVIHGAQSDPMIRNNRIHNAEQNHGIYLYENAKGTIKRNEIFKNECGIFIDLDCDPVVHKNQIYDNKGTGIWIEGNGTIEQNEIFKNEKYGIYVDSKATPIVRKNQLHESNHEQFAEKIVDVVFVGKPRDILVVGGLKGYATISEALQVASSETTIRVMAGIYRESLVIDKNITIIGVGKIDEIVIIGLGKSVLLSTAKQARIQNVTLEQEDSDNPCVDISSGEIQIERCDISGGKNCIAIHGAQSAPIIRNNRIHDAKQDYEKNPSHGIYLYENAKSIIEQNEVFKNDLGIVVSSNNVSVVRKNKVYKNEWSGIMIFGQGTFTQNEIFKNEMHGIHVESNGDPIVRENRIHENKESGIEIFGQGTFTQNEIFKNEKHGIIVNSSAASIINSNQIYENKLEQFAEETVGLVLVEKPKDVLVVGNVNGYKTLTEALRAASNQTTIRVLPGIYRESLVIDKNVTIFGVGKVGEIVIIGARKLIGPGKSAISSTAKQARIQNITLKQEGKKHPCIDISAGGIQIERCDISGGNNCIAIHGAQSMPIIENNQIHDAKKAIQDRYPNKTGHGIYLYENAKGTIKQNKIFKNEKHGIYVYLTAKPVVRDNQLHENKWSGIGIFGGGTFEKNKIFKNEKHGIYVYSTAEPVVRDNQLHENNLEQFVSVKKSKSVLIVNSININGYTTITKALEAALPETTIQIMPGIYRESLVIDKNVTIIGVGKVDEIVIIGSGKSAILSTAKQARIQNVTLQQEGGDNPCVDISAGKILIERCDISGGNSCIAIHGSSDSMIRNNRIHHAEQNHERKSSHGIYFYENAKGTIKQNEIYKNERGILIDKTCDSVVHKNQIYENKGTGIVVWGKSTIEKNEIFKNDLGIIVSSNSISMVRKNQIYENRWSGIEIKGEGTFEENEIFKNEKNGIYVDSKADSIVRNNRIHENKENGLKILGNGTFEENEIFKNEGNGIYVSLSGAPVMRSNRVYENKESGIAIDGKGTFEANDISKNKNHGIYVNSTGDPVVFKNQIHGNKEYGILIERIEEDLYRIGSFKQNNVYENIKGDIKKPINFVLWIVVLWIIFLTTAIVFFRTIWLK